MARRRSNEQPIRVPTGGDFGARKQLEAQQAAVPLPRSHGPAAPNGPRGGAQAAPAGGGGLPGMDVFGPTARPGEPLTAGAEGAPSDPVEVLRAIWLRYPSPGVRRLLERAVRQSGRSMLDASEQNVEAGPPPMDSQGGPGGTPPMNGGRR